MEKYIFLSLFPLGTLQWGRFKGMKEQLQTSLNIQRELSPLILEQSVLYSKREEFGGVGWLMEDSTRISDFAPLLCS